MRSYFLRGYGTTRRFPRTTSEAFLCDAEAAIWWDRPPRFGLGDALCWVLGCAILAAIVSAPWWFPLIGGR